MSRPILLTGVLLGASACGDFPDREALPLDCSVEDTYELSVLRPFDDVGTGTWFSADDQTGYVPCGEGIPVEQDPSVPVDENAPCLEPGPRAAVATATIEALPDGDRCGDVNAAVLRAERNHDWGSIFGDYDLASITAPRDASEYEGVALWARASVGTDKGVLVLLDDQYTTAAAGICDEPEVVEGTRGPELVGQPGVVLPGTVPKENDCGNSFQRVLTVTERWQLHLLPFSSFSQDPLPNRRLSGIDSSALYGMVFRAPKAARLELWIDDIAYYRRRPE